MSFKSKSRKYGKWIAIVLLILTIISVINIYNADSKEEKIDGIIDLLVPEWLGMIPFLLSFGIIGIIVIVLGALWWRRYVKLK